MNPSSPKPNVLRCFVCGDPAPQILVDQINKAIGDLKDQDARVLAEVVNCPSCALLPNIKALRHAALEMARVKIVRKGTH